MGTEAAEHIETDITEILRAAIMQKNAEGNAEKLRALAIPEKPPKGENLSYWNTTAEEVAQINAGDLEAVNAFYLRNELHIKYAAYAFFSHSRCKSVIDADDLTHQFYIDLATGVVKLRPWDRAISNAARHSFRYAAIGGAGNYSEEFFVPFKWVEKCLNRAN